MEFAKGVLYSLPSTYLDKPFDRVSYVQTVADGTENGKTYSFPEAVCYAGVIFQARSYEVGVKCSPTKGNNSSPSMPFQRFFRLLKKAGVVPKQIKIEREKGLNTIVIPQAEWERHQLFVALSMYRHADLHGRSIMGRSIKTYDKLEKSGVHFLQCLHWAFVNTAYGIHHSCINLSGSKGLYGGGLPKFRNNLKYGIALALYGKLSVEERKAITGESDGQSTSMFIALAETLKDFPIQDRKEILDPRYSILYENPIAASKETK